MGTGNPREFVTVVPKGAREGAYDAYVYVPAAGGDLKLAMPAKPGDYELRLCEAASPYKTLVAKPITLTGSSATVSAPASVAAGATFEVKWTGPNNERDYIAVGETTPGGRLYLDYKYSRDGSPMKLAAPEKPGNYEVRYILGVGDTVIARQPITVGGVTATVTGPAQVAAGAKFKVSWTGPNNPRDFVTMVKAGTREKTYERYVYTDKGSTLEFTAPDATRRLRAPLRHRQGIPHAGPRAHHRRCDHRHDLRARPGSGRRDLQGVVERPGQCAQFRHHRAKGRARGRVHRVVFLHDAAEQSGQSRRTARRRRIRAALLHRRELPHDGSRGHPDHTGEERARKDRGDPRRGHQVRRRHRDHPRRLRQHAAEVRHRSGASISPSRH